MKIFNQTTNISSNAYQIDANMNLLFIMFFCAFIYLLIKMIIDILELKFIKKTKRIQKIF